MHISRLVATAALSVGLTLVSSGAALAAPKSSSPTVGYDVSYPQCDGPLPAQPAFGIVGVSDGSAYGESPCLAQQYAWALAAPKAPPAFYMNTGNPGTLATRVNWYAENGPEHCDIANEAGCAYNYGYHAARDAFEYASSESSPTAATTAAWWLDVETANSWSTEHSLNVRDIQGSIDYLRNIAGVRSVGIYSTGYQWGHITGGANLGPAIPNWVAGALNAKRAPALCSSSFSGGKFQLVQYPSGGFDANYTCA